MLHQYIAGRINDAHDAVSLNFKRLIVRAVFFGLHRHQTHVRYSTHGGRIKRAVGLTEVDHFLIDTGVSGLRHNRLGVLGLAVAAPHLTGVADHGRHGGVNDNVRRNVQVGDALDGIHHGHFRTVFVAGVDRFFDLVLSGLRQGLDLFVDAAHAVVRVNADFVEQITVLVEHFAVEHTYRVAEYDRVGDLHHGRLDVQGPHHAAFLAVLQRFFEEGVQRLGAHEHAVQNFTFFKAQFFLHFRLAVVANEFDADITGFSHGDGLFAGEEVAAAHVVGVRAGRLAPLAHGVRELACKCLDRGRGATVRVALTQNRVYRAAENTGVTSLGVFFFVSLRVVEVFGNVVALALQFLDGGTQLGYGSTDVRQLDDVGFGILGQFAQECQTIFNALLFGQALGEGSENTTGQRNVAQINFNIGCGSKGADDRQQRCSRQSRGFISECVDDF